jgi:hypothetical protein
VCSHSWRDETSLLLTHLAATLASRDFSCNLGLSIRPETAVKVAIHRLRVRFRELIRAEVAATVNDPEEVSGELRHLIAVASRG